MFNRRVNLDISAGFSGNPSSPHEEGRHAKEILEKARVTIARLVEVQADDVIFTSGATEANAIVILGSVRARLHLKPCTLPLHVLYLPSSHASIVENVKMLGEKGVKIEPLPIKGWRVDCEKLKELLRPETVLVAMDAVCGETGVVWNTREVASALHSNKVQPCKSPRKFHNKVEPCFIGTILHVDASQAPLTEKITRAHFGADTMTLDASKVGAVRGIGALIAHRTIPIEPLYRGGEQERGLRPGSESPELAEEFAAALRATTLNREKFCASAEKNRKQLIEKITTSIPNAYVNESQSQAPHILNFSFPGCDTDYLVALLDEAGFAVSTRSACETDSEDGSRAVFALTGNEERARTTLRISWGPDTSSRELSRFAKELVKAVAFSAGSSIISV